MKPRLTRGFVVLSATPPFLSHGCHNDLNIL
jgi:hypothetical protein